MRKTTIVGLTVGTDPSGVECVIAEAARVIKSAMDRGMPHNPPITGKGKSEI